MGEKQACIYEKGDTWIVELHHNNDENDIDVSFFRGTRARANAKWFAFGLYARSNAIYVKWGELKPQP